MSKNLALQESDLRSPAAPVLKFQYLYNYPFLTVAQGLIQKYNYEPKAQLTTVTGVEQLDDDRFTFYRRVENVYGDRLNWERVTVDRREGGKITSELVGHIAAEVDKVFERSTLQGVGENAVQHTHDLIEHQGIKTLKVVHFKTNVEKLIKAIKFAQFESQQ